MTAIRTRGVTKVFGDLRAVDAIDLDVPAGGVVGFVGPNGAGKSTTIRMLLGLIEPTSGDGEVLGHPIADPSGYLHRVGALIEAPAFYPTLTGHENLRVFATLGGHDRRRIAELLEVVGLGGRGGDRYRNYSLGMKQRLGIAAALLPDPDLLVLDEPTNGLDPQGIVEIRTLLRDIGASGKTVFVSSHLLAEIQAACDSIVMIDRGGVVFGGTMTDLLEHTSSTIRAVADTGLWRELPDAPFPRTPSALAWTGEELISWGNREGTNTAGAIYDPDTEQWRPMVDAPEQGRVYAATWAGEKLVVVARGGAAAYDPHDNAWTELPTSGLSPQAVAATATESVVVAYDYLLDAGYYDLGAGTWNELPSLPLGAGECFPDAGTLTDGTVVAFYCGQLALLDPSKSAWDAIEVPGDGNGNLLADARPVVAPDGLHLLSSGTFGGTAQHWHYQP